MASIGNRRMQIMKSMKTVKFASIMHEIKPQGVCVSGASGNIGWGGGVACHPGKGVGGGGDGGGGVVRSPGKGVGCGGDAGGGVVRTPGRGVGCGGDAGGVGRIAAGGGGTA